MLKKITAISLSALFLGCGFGLAGAVSISEEERAAKMQSLEIAKYSSQSTRYKLNRIVLKIKENELKLKYLKARRDRLDGKMATILQLKEGAWLFGRLKLFFATKKILKKIEANESKIKICEEKRNSLDEEFLELLQLREI